MKQTDVFITKKYEIFKTLEGNRGVNESHVRALMKSMEAEYIPIPIVINPKYEVIDGQHRLEAAKRLKLPVHFIQRNNLGLHEVQILNENQKKWNSADWAHSFSDLGNENYTDFITFTEKYKFPARETIYMLEGGGRKDKSMELFRQGKFKVKSYAAACEMAEKIIALKDLTPLYRKTRFISALFQLFKNKDYNHKEFVRKLKIFPTMLVNCPDAESYIKIIEKIYNYKNHPDNLVRFT